MQKEEEKAAKPKQVPINCVFFHDKTCPVREDHKARQSTSFFKYLKPETETMMKQAMEIMDKMATQHMSMGSLPEYCKSCPFLKVWQTKECPIPR